jgi:predicted transposase YdaD
MQKSEDPNLSDWLRWCDRQGNWLLSDEEQAQAQLLQAAQNLLATGMELAQIVTLLGLSAEQVEIVRSSK